MELFKIYADSIATILSGSSFELYEIELQNLDLDLPFEPHLWRFLKNNQNSFAVYSRRFWEIRELGGDPSKFNLQNNIYIKYVNGLRKHKKGVNDRQVLFKEIIINHILAYHRTSRGTYFYTTADDVRKFFSGEIKSKADLGKVLYQKFLNENGKYDFNLSIDSISKYLKNSLFFTKMRIHFKGRRMNIYTLSTDYISSEYNV